MALNVGQLLSPPVNTQVGGVKAGTGITIDADGTISTEGGGLFPGTTINFPTTIPGTAASTPWGAPGTLLFSTGCLEFAVDGVTFNQGPTAVVAGNIVTTRWVVSPSCGGAPNGTVITGTLTDGTYEVSSSFQIDRVPSGFTFGDLTSQPLSSLVTSNPLIPSGFNSTAYVTVQVGATLTGVEASVGGGAFTAIPTTGTTLPINPGQSLQIRGTTGSTANTTYSVVVSIGADASVSSDTWDVTTVAATAAISQPSILTPPDGTTGLNPALNTPAGITLTSSAYTPLNGAGAQTSSLWEAYKGGYPLLSTNAITGVTQSSLEWSLARSTTGVDYTSGLYAGGNYVFVGRNSGSSTSGITIWSANGTNLTNVTSAINTVMYTVSYANGVYFFGGTSTSLGNIRLATSTGPGAGYNYFSIGDSVIIRASTYALGLWIIAGTGGALYTSATAVPSTSSNFTSRVSSFGTTDIYSLASNGTTVVAVGAAGKVATSTNGTSWTQRANPFGGTNDIRRVAYGAGTFVAVGDGGGIMTSATGTGGWTLRTSGTTANLQDVLYTGTQFVVVGDSGTTLTSPDGVTWTAVSPSGTTDSLNAVAGTDATLAAVGPGQNLYAYSSSTTLTIAGAQTDGFLVDDTVISNPAGAGPSSIASVNNSNVIVAPPDTNWAIGQKIERDPASYSVVNGFPATISAAPFTTIDIPQADLAVSSTYYARVQYATTNASAATSEFSAWSSFATAGSFAIPIGTAYGGGYFAGQINDGGTIYNLIVAPVRSGTLFGQNGGGNPSGIQYKTTATADLPTATVENAAYGGTTTDLFKASAVHPVFSTFINGATGPNAGAFNLATGGAGGGTGIGGYNDWYLPAKNELEILYRNLKPTTTPNGTSFGANANAVPTATGNYTAGDPAQTTSTLFQEGGAQQFASTRSYWSSTQSTSVEAAWRAVFSNGTQAISTKDSSVVARAIRRVAA